MKCAWQGYGDSDDYHYCKNEADYIVSGYSCCEEHRSEFK